MEIEELVFKTFHNKASAGEEKAVEDFYKVTPDECGDITRDLHIINDLTELEDVTLKIERNRKAVRRKNILGIFAKTIAAACVVIVSGYVSHFLTKNSFSEMLTTIEAPRGEIVRVILPDSTLVFLNSEASITYPAVFIKNRREVALRGEAMFEVTRNENRPFVVKTFASDIEVLGTKFNVISEEEEKFFSTALLEGKVVLTNVLGRKDSRFIMQPDDIVLIEDGQFKLTRNERQDICWTQGLIKIDDKNFKELMEEFEKSFDVEIIIEKEDLPDMCGASGKIRINDGIDNALKVLKHIADFNFRRDYDGNIITIY